MSPSHFVGFVFVVGSVECAAATGSGAGAGGVNVSFAGSCTRR